VGEALRQADGSDGLAFSAAVGVVAVTTINSPRALECGVGEQLQLDFSALRSPLFKNIFPEFRVCVLPLESEEASLHKSYEFCS